MSARDARAEARERLGGRYEPRVLEPSPPAVSAPPWFADDPPARGEVASGRIVVSPVGTGDVSWLELAADDPALAAWCAERWLGPYRRLPAAPPGLERTRRALHLVAATLIAPARQRANGKIGLRYTLGGFGTPFFGAEVQVRIERGELVVQEGASERRAPLTSLAAAAELIGPDLLPGDVAVNPEPLAVDRAGAEFLGDWYGFGASVLEELRAQAGAEDAAARVQLWPEHFDIALELGSEAAGARAGYGCSPGDEQHAEPYLYVTPWSAPPPGELWQATEFAGAGLPFRALLGAGDQRAEALRFFGARWEALKDSDL